MESARKGKRRINNERNQLFEESYLEESDPQNLISNNPDVSEDEKEAVFTKGKRFRKASQPFQRHEKIVGENNLSRKLKLRLPKSDAKKRGKKRDRNDPPVVRYRMSRVSLYLRLITQCLPIT